MGGFRIIYIFLAIKTWEVFSITRRIEQNQPVRNFRRHAGPLPPTDWELGLRESVHQALLREHHTDPALRDQLLEAPFLGRQDTASPFGDIAVLARGQLYITSEGYKFVQDSEQDDCAECYHNHECAKPQCQQLWTNLGHHHKLLALWTVKRIRHRDQRQGHVFEIEYTISPITSAINEELVRRHGYFDYNVPGHIFVIKSNPRLNAAYHLNNNADKSDKWYGSQASEQHPVDQQYHEHFRERGSGHLKPGILIGVSPDGYKHVLHSFPGFYSSYHPQTNHHDQTTIDPKEYELYKKLIESLASKTTHSTVPHRFALTTPKEITTLPATKPTYHQLTTFIPIPETTFVQFPDGQLVPLTQNTAPPTTTKYQDHDLHVVTPVRFPTTSKTTKYSEPDIFYRPLQTTTHLPTPEPPKPITMPMTTTIHYYTPVEEPETVVNSRTTMTTRKQSTTSLYTTLKPSKTPSTNVIEKDDFGLFSGPTEPIQMTTKTFSFTNRKTTKHAFTQEVESDLFPVNTSTEPMRPVTEIPSRTRPDSINEQLPPPDKDTETTIPYVSSAVTEPSTITKLSTIEVAPVTRQQTTATQAITSIFVPSTTHEERTTAVIERVPYTEERTTVFTRTPSTETEKATTIIVGTVPSRGQDKITTIITAVPSTTQEKITTVAATVPSTTPEKIITFHPTEKEIATVPFTTITEKILTTNGETSTTSKLPSTELTTSMDGRTTEALTFTETIPSTRKPTTIVDYSFDSTTRGSSLSTNALTETPSTIYYPTTETEKNTFPTTTTHYYYSLETSLPKTTTITTSAATTTNSIPQTTSTTKKRTKKPKPSEIIDDFLADSDGGGKNENTAKDNKKDVNEDDIFGEAPRKPSAQPTETTTKKVTVQSDLAQALFGGRRAKQIKVSSKVRRNRVTYTPKVIYKNFYSPSTAKTSPTTNMAPYDTTTSFDGTTESRPVTDQSYSTSISVEVNKRNITTPLALRLEPTVVAKVSEVVNRKGDYKVYKAEFPREMVEVVKTSKRDKIENKKVFDDIALQLVNHARSIDYLNKRPSRQPKYRRRSYTTKSRRSYKKSNN